MNFKDLVQQRRSHRVFTSEPIDAEAVQLILRSALMSPTSKNVRGWHFIVVDDPQKLAQIADAKEAGAHFIKGAPLAVVVAANPAECECWIEDCAAAAITMQYQAEDLGLGSCWAQIRGRRLSDGTSSTDVIRGIVSLPEDVEVLCVVAFGQKGTFRQLQNEDKLKWEQVHVNQW